MRWTHGRWKAPIASRSSRDSASATTRSTSTRPPPPASRSPSRPTARAGRWLSPPSRCCWPSHTTCDRRTASCASAGTGRSATSTTGWGFRQDAGHHRVPKHRPRGQPSARTPRHARAGVQPVLRHREGETRSGQGVSIEELMAESEAIVVTAALTPETRHIVNAERLALMKHNAVIVNVARGPLIDQKALADVLAAGRIRGPASTCSRRSPPTTTIRFWTATTSSSRRTRPGGPTSSPTATAQGACARSSRSSGASDPHVVVNPAALEHERWTGVPDAPKTVS